MTAGTHDSEKAKFLPDNIRVNMLRLDAKDVAQSQALEEVLRTIVECDAIAHGADFNGKKFGHVLNAIAKNKVQAYFVMLEKDGLPRFGGGAIQFPTILTYWNGTAFDHFPAIYREDIFVMPELSSEFRQWTKSADFPNGVGLGAYLTDEEIKAAVSGTPDDMPFGMTAHGLLGEYAPDNNPIVNSLGKMGSNLGTEKDSAILYFPYTLDVFQQTEQLSVQTQSLLSGTALFPQACPSVFTVLWKSADDKQQIVASFTEALSTFRGETVVRAQITSNKNLPHKKILKNILKAIICAGAKEIEERGWIEEKSQNLLERMRFHALQEPEIVSALKAIEGEPRSLGQHVMQPITLRFQDIPHNMTSFYVPSAAPMETYANYDSLYDNARVVSEANLAA